MGSERTRSLLPVTLNLAVNLLFRGCQDFHINPVESVVSDYVCLYPAFRCRASGGCGQKDFPCSVSAPLEHIHIEVQGTLVILYSVDTNPLVVNEFADCGVCCRGNAHAFCEFTLIVMRIQSEGPLQVVFGFRMKKVGIHYPDVTRVTEFQGLRTEAVYGRLENALGYVVVRYFYVGFKRPCLYRYVRRVRDRYHLAFAGEQKGKGQRIVVRTFARGKLPLSALNSFKQFVCGDIACYRSAL